MTSHSDLYVGLLSGTSADGIDAALVSFSGSTLQLIETHLEPLPIALRQDLLSLFVPGKDQIDLMGQLDTELGDLFAQATLSLLEKAGVAPNHVKAIGCHGQTIRHRPSQTNPFTLQIGNPHCLSQRTGLDGITDFRRRDMATGGQGAPLAPLFHQAFMSSKTENRVILNIGGIANLTYLPQSGRPLAFDIGPGNGLMDAWCLKHTNQPFDREGRWAENGEPQPDLIQAALDATYFQQPPPKSTGKEAFHLDWLQQIAPRSLDNYAPVDIQASLMQLTVRSIHQAIERYCPETERVLVCGGGVHNNRLMALLSDDVHYCVESTDALHMDPDWVEAMTFAWLARCFQKRQALDVSPFTGGASPILLGAYFPTPVSI